MKRGATANPNQPMSNQTQTETHELSNGVINHSDCLDGLQELDSDSICLAFTSPPYFDVIDYESQAATIDDDDERWGRTDISYDEYQSFLVERFAELFRVIQPGGHAVVNIAPVTTDDGRVPLPFHFVGWMEDIGWNFKEDIVWEKPVAKDRRSGVFIQHPYPGYYYPSLVSEYVFVFQKEADTDSKNNIYWNRTQQEKENSEVSLDDFQGEKSKNVWKIRPVSPGENIHPAPFPRDLAKRVIELYSYQGDTVIDIFAGSGQSLLAAQDLSRSFVGMETQSEYIRYATERIQDENAQTTLNQL